LKQFGLNKEERIKSKKLFDNIFSKGKSVKSGFIRLNYFETQFDSANTAKVAFSVPKKIFKRAVKRNLLKRRTREAYRLNKISLYDFLTLNNIKIAILFVYLAKDEKTYSQIEKEVLKTIKLLIAKLENK
jgi:ribonuclease P protein component